MPTFTILLPVFRPPALLPFAVQSVQRQLRTDWELFIICDGAPPETVATAEEFARTDARIRVRAHPKDERHGEIYRHHALLEATGTLVCQIADDDLWLPHHLDEIEALLGEADFGHVLQVAVGRSDEVSVIPSDLGQREQRDRMLCERYNTFGPTVCGYRRSAYAGLGTGWSPAPKGIWSDLFMWRKFLAAPGLVYATRMAMTALSFPSPARTDMDLVERAAETARWFERAADPAFAREFEQLALAGLVRQCLAQETPPARRKPRWVRRARQAWAALRGTLKRGGAGGDGVPRTG